MSKFRIISIKKAIFIILFYTLLFFAYGIYTYKTETQQAMCQVRSELLMGANALPLLLPQDYLEGKGITEVSKEAKEQIARKLEDFISHTDLAYIFSVVHTPEGRLLITSSNVLKEGKFYAPLDPRQLHRLFLLKEEKPLYTTVNVNGRELHTLYHLKFTEDDTPYVVGALYRYERFVSIHEHILNKILYLILPLLFIISLYVFANYFVFIYLRNSLAKKTEALKKAFEYDSLTHLPSKRKLLADIQECPQTTPIAIIDINKFSIINDIYGSDYADRYLQYTATVLHNRLSEDMRLYRLDSDAFAVWCRKAIPIEEFKHFITDLIQNASQKRFVYKGYASKLLLRAGISDTTRRSNPLIHAEIALKKAKTSAQHLLVYSMEIDQNTHNKEVLDDITHALDNNGVMAYFQPIYDIAEHKITKYEVLMRIQKRNGEIAVPEYFLDVAKHTPLYKELTLAMLEHLVQIAQQHPCLGFSINLSSMDIEDREFIGALLEKLQQKGVAHQITIELLESEEFKDFEYLFEFIKRARKMGIKISIDDFGSGYSNISSTIKLDIDYIKIDGSLILHVLHDVRYEKVIKSIVNFAKEMNAKTVAEFVESEEIAKKLKELGIDMLQGYYIAKPSASLRNEL